MADRFDAIVVGSGFGGAVTACRLAEAGARVLVLERGRRWTKDQYPRKASDAWLYSHRRPEKHHGWLDVRLFPGMTVLAGAGVGGGSLCYSSVLLEADDASFGAGWPAEVTRAELAPHYATARRMLGARTIPEGQLTQRYKLMQRAAERTGDARRFSAMPLALTFDEEWNYDLPDAMSARHSKPVHDNGHGKRQGTCVHLGNCDIGCDVDAKNTLDLNYLAAAENAGAEIRPLHMVRRIEPVGNGYRVAFDRIENGKLVPGAVEADRVILAAGSLGSTELLLRCRDQYRTLPRVGRSLGQGWSPNANVLTPDIYPRAADVRQSAGPTISAGMQFMDGGPGSERFVLEDDGFPNLLLNALTAKLGSAWLNPLAWALRPFLRRGPGELNPLARVAVWLGAGVDAGDGRLTLGRPTFAPWRTDLCLDWNVRKSRRVIDAILRAQGRLSRAGGGRLRVPLYWSLLRALVTVHPLGGCRMGSTAADGVVDHRGEVFGHPNLFVADGSVMPGPIGWNPSLTIAALAERGAGLMLRP
ncbi:MAG TPA: GMC family oxidoreductase [Urbifossiella sp.]|nr:GMC family oxidoreductase [Urbifossiella sp.]